MTVLVHKAVEPDKLSVAGKKRFAMLVQDLIQGGDTAIVQPKYDGVYAQFLFQEGEWRAFSRTGQRLLSVSREIMASFEVRALPQVRYMGELWLPNEQHQTINGRARKQSEQYLELKLFDAAMIGGDSGSYYSRQDYLFSHGLVERVPNLPVRGQINVLDDLYDMAAKLKLRPSAYDGLILRDLDGRFIPGAGKDGEIIKIKPRAEGDFRVVGFTPGVGNRAGGIGSLVVDLGGSKLNEVGTGLTMKEVFDVDSPVGRIATVEYLGLTKDGKLREPSFKAYRFDKTEADVLDFTQQTED